MITVSDFIFQYLAQNVSARHVFMLPGGGCMHLVDSLGRNDKLSFVCTLHEQAAAIAAEAYAQYSGDLGLVLVTTGPGSTNAITGVAGAWIDSTPMLIISGQAKREDLLTGRGVRQMGVQEVDIVSVVSPITKYANCLLDPNMVKFELQKAIHIASTGRRGPVWLDVPLDVQGATVDETSLVDYTPEALPSADAPDLPAAAGKILSLLRNAKRPAILAGNGIRASGSVASFMKLAETWQVPVLTTWKAADFLSEDHPLFAGRPGSLAQRGANFVQQSADFLLILGARLDLCQTGFNHPHFAHQAKRVIVDIDPNEIAKLDMQFELQLTADAGAVIAALHDTRDQALPDFSAWLAHCKELHKRFPVVLPEYRSPDADKVNTYYLIDVLSDVLPANAVIVPGSSGGCAEVTLQAFRIKQGQRELNTPGLGAMGFGLAATIGACLASDQETTIGIVGDGGLQLNIQELETLKRLNLPIKLFVLNNGGYGSIYNMQKSRFDGNFVACHEASGLSLPDICSISDAYGITNTRIADQHALESKVRAVLALDGPVVIDVIVDPDVTTAPRLSSEVLPDGRIISKPIEDLWPFLPDSEIESNLNWISS